MYLKYQREKALQLYDQCKSVSKVIQQLVYPTQKRLMTGLLIAISLHASKLPDESLIMLRTILVYNQIDN